VSDSEITSGSLSEQLVVWGLVMVNAVILPAMGMPFRSNCSLPSSS
jgi:hypothetical protein